MVLSILDKAKNIIDFILKGIGDVFNFFMELPTLINSLINIIPEPFRQVIFVFMGIILIYFIAKAVFSLVN